MCLYGYGLSTNPGSSFSSDQVVESTLHSLKFISRKTRRHETRCEIISKSSKQNEGSIVLEFCLLSEKTIVDLRFELPSSSNVVADER